LKDTNKASSRFGDPEEDLQLFKEGLLKTIIVPNNVATFRELYCVFKSIFKINFGF